MMNTKTRAAMLLLLTFAAGGAIGAVADRAYVVRGVQREQPKVPEPRRSESNDVDRIPTPLERLGLTPDEQARLHVIARRWRPRAGEWLGEARRRVAGMENDMFAEMLCVLPAEKRDRYLEGIKTSGLPPEVIEKRFALVRSQRCPEEPPVR